MRIAIVLYGLSVLVVGSVRGATEVPPASKAADKPVTRAANQAVDSAPDTVVIYRCTDARGELTLRDTPCAKDQAQQTKTMMRPKDAPMPAPRATPAEAVAGGAAEPRTRIVVRTAPRPLYECVRPDGSVYTSDTGEGQPRYVPLWTLDYPIYPSLRPSTSTQIDIRTDHLRYRSNTSEGSYPPAYGSAYGPAYGAAMTFVRDACHPLPQSEVCARLVDRRDEIRRRFFNAMPSERRTLSTEERGIDARLANDCDR